MKVAQKALIVVSVPLLFELVFIGLLSFMLFQADSRLHHEIRSRQIITVANKLMMQLAEAASLGAAFTLVRNQKLTAAYETNRDAALRSLSALEDLTRTRPELGQSIQGISKDVRSLLDGYRIIFEQPDLLTSTIYNQDRPDVRTSVDKVATALHKVSAVEERSALDSLFVRENKSDELRLVLIEGLIVDLALTSFLFLFFIRGISQRLEQVRDNMDNLAARKPLKPQLSGDDEIAQIDATLHMAGDRLQAAEEKKLGAIVLVREELKKPLVSINDTLARLLNAPDLSSKATSRLRIAETSMSRLLRLIEELLSLGAPAHQKFQLNYATLSLGKLCSASMEAVSALVSEKGSEIRSNILDQNFEADADHLQQVVINLLTNALKYSPAGTTITLNARPNENGIRIEVLDEGRGIPISDQQKIFEPFGQSAEADVKTGSGLGLAICKEIVEQHGGGIFVESEPGKGSRFWIDIPVRRPAQIVGSAQSKRVVRWGLGQKGLVIISLPLFLTVALVTYLSIALDQLDKEIQRELRASEKVALIHDVLNRSARHGTILTAEQISHNPGRAKLIGPAVARADGDILKLKELVKSDPYETQLVEKLNREILAMRKLTPKTVNASGANIMNTLQSLGIFGFAKNLTTLKSIANEFGVRSKRNEEVARAGRMRLVQSIKIIIPSITVLGLLITVFGGIQFMTSISNRLIRLRNNAERVCDRGELLESQPGEDEIAVLDRFFFETAARLRELEEFRTHVIGITSHELKSPLQTMQNVLYSLNAGMYGDLTDDVKNLAHSADLELRWLICLVNDLLDVQKIEVGKFAVDPAETSLCDLCRESVMLVEKFAASDVAVTWKADDAAVTVDRGRMLSVLVATLSNLIGCGARSVQLHGSLDGEELTLCATASGVTNIPDGGVLDRFNGSGGLIYSLSADDTDNASRDNDFERSLSRRILQAHQGSAELQVEDQAIVCRLRLAAPSRTSA